MKDSVVFYQSFYDAIKELPKETQAEAYSAIFDYSFNGNEPKEKGIISAIFKMAKPQIDANNKRYANGKKGAEFGHLGGRPKKNTKEEDFEENLEVNSDEENNPTETPNCENETPNDNDNVNVNDNVNDKEKAPPAPSRGKRFRPPTVEEVSEYCRERNNDINPEAFVAFYDSKDWMIGKSKMKNWKSAIITWEQRQAPVKRKNALSSELKKIYGG